MLASATTEINDGYILGRTYDEYQRLHIQALKWESITHRVLQQMGLKPGMINRFKQKFFRLFNSVSHKLSFKIYFAKTYLQCIGRKIKMLIALCN